METQNKFDNLADTMFEIMEDISQVEETIEQGRKNFEALEEAVKSLESSTNAMKEMQDSNIKKMESLDNILERLNKIEQSVNSLADSDILKLLNQKIDKKVLLKNEIAKYQKMILGILGILAFLALGSIAFLMLGLALSMNATIAFIVIIASLIIALLVINGNLKQVIAEEKITPKKSHPKPAVVSSTDSTKQDNAPKSPQDMEIKSTFDDF